MLASVLAEEGEMRTERDGVSVVVKGQSTWTSRPSGKIDVTLAILSGAMIRCVSYSALPFPFVLSFDSLYATRQEPQVFGLVESSRLLSLSVSSFHATIPLSRPRSR